MNTTTKFEIHNNEQGIYITRLEFNETGDLQNSEDLDTLYASEAEAQVAKAELEAIEAE